MFQQHPYWFHSGSVLHGSSASGSATPRDHQMSRSTPRSNTSPRSVQMGDATPLYDERNINHDSRFTFVHLFMIIVFLRRSCWSFSWSRWNFLSRIFLITDYHDSIFLFHFFLPSSTIKKLTANGLWFWSWNMWLSVGLRFIYKSFTLA